MALIDDKLKQAVRDRLRRFLEESAEEHGDAVMESDTGQKVAEVAAYVYGVVTDNELDLQTDHEDFNAAVRRGTQLGRAVRKGYVDDDA